MIINSSIFTCLFRRNFNNNISSTIFAQVKPNEHDNLRNETDNKVKVSDCQWVGRGENE